MAYTDFYGFIDSTYIKENSTLATSFDDEKLLPFIVTAQEKYILPLLGSNLYNDIQAEVKAFLQSGTPITANYVSLINNYVKNTLMHYTLYEAVPFLNFNLTNINVAKKNSEFSQASAVGEVTYIRNIIKSTCQYYADRLEAHLIAEASTKYPKYYETTSGTDSEPPKGSETFCGIYLGKSRRKCY